MNINTSGTVTSLFTPAAISGSTSGTYLVDLTGVTGKFMVIANCSQVVGAGACDLNVYTYDTSGGTETLKGTLARVSSGTGAPTSGSSSLVLDSRDCGKYILALPTISGTATLTPGLQMVTLANV
jgi:hypothetical protein